MNKPALSFKNYVYGPVPSRRLGFSLGIDLTPCKSCSFDCIYCQLGKTTHKTIRRFEFVDLKRLEYQLNRKLLLSSRIDYITISGSGEPTLHKNLDKIIRLLKKSSQGKIPLALITNSSLLSRRQVREEIKEVDLIVPSLDAATQRTFELIDRPHKNIRIENIIEGLIKLRRSFRGKIWLEIMLVRDINTPKREIARLASAVAKIKPDKIHINLPVRPARYGNLIPSLAQQRFAREQLGEICEIVDSFSRQKQQKMFTDIEKDIGAYLKRRPASIEDLEYAFGLNRNEIIKYLDILIRKGVVKQQNSKGQEYFIYGL